MAGIGTPEIIIIVLILLLLFGGKKIPELMRGLGSGVKEFKKATTLEEEPETRRNYDRPTDDRRDDRRDERRAEDRRIDSGGERPYDARTSEDERKTEVR